MQDHTAHGITPILVRPCMPGSAATRNRALVCGDMFELHFNRNACASIQFSCRVTLCSAHTVLLHNCSAGAHAAPPRAAKYHSDCACGETHNEPPRAAKDHNDRACGANYNEPPCAVKNHEPPHAAKNCNDRACGETHNAPCIKLRPHAVQVYRRRQGQQQQRSQRQPPQLPQSRAKRPGPQTPTQMTTTPL